MKDNNLKRLWHLFLKYFGQGLLYILPIGITIWVLWAIFLKLDSIFEFETPGMGLLTLIGLITAVGLVGSLLISTPVFKYFNRLIERTPLVKMIYNAIKDLLSVFVGNKKKFTEPVLVRLSRDMDLEQVGFVTQKDLRDMDIDDEKVSVYIPFPFSMMGSLYIVPVENIKVLNVKPEDALKFAISGGVSKAEEQNNNEEEEDI